MEKEAKEETGIQLARDNWISIHNFRNTQVIVHEEIGTRVETSTHKKSRRKKLMKNASVPKYQHTLKRDIYVLD